MSARRIPWRHFPSAGVPRSQVCEKVGANAAHNLLLDLRIHHHEMLQRVVYRARRFGRKGRRDSQFRRDMAALIAPTLAIATSESSWQCIYVRDAKDHGDRLCASIEIIRSDLSVEIIDTCVTEHAIARLAQRRHGTDPETLYRGLRRVLRSALSVSATNPTARRSRRDLEGRLPTADGTWGIARVSGSWVVRTFLDADPIASVELRPARHEDLRQEDLERSRRRGHPF